MEVLEELADSDRQDIAGKALELMEFIFSGFDDSDLVLMKGKR